MSIHAADQWEFLKDIAKLIQWADQNGYTLTSGEFLRTPVQAWINSCPPNSTLVVDDANNSELHYWEKVGGVGKSQSLHLSKVAADFALFKDGVEINTVEGFRPLGDYWKSLNPINRWGGDFVSPRPDAYHFERNVP